MTSPSSPPVIPTAPAPDAYARGHALFESRSDQRSLITDWLDARLARRSAQPDLAVLSVGCGDGSVDAELARRACAAAPGARRSWTGLDPHAAVVARFRDAMEGVDEPGLRVDSHAARFEDLRTEERYDVVVFVHSLYYVADLAAALRDAVGLLSPGGELLVLHAPLGALNRLAARLSPTVSGHPQPWSDAVAEALAALPVLVERSELLATVDLGDAGTVDPAMLDFTVQAVLDGRGREDVLVELDVVSEPGPGRRVAHPVTAFVVRPTGAGAVTSLSPTIR